MTSAVQLTLNPLINQLITTLLEPVGQPTNQLINQQTNHQFTISAETRYVSTLPEILLQKCNIVVYLSSDFFGQNVGKNWILLKNGNLLAADLNKPVKYASFISRKCPKPRTGTR